MINLKTAFAVWACTGAVAHADITVRFVEGAPTDRFVLSSSADCPTGAVSVAIDLTGSAGALIFDVTAQGQGVEVFQPLTLVSGADHVREISEIADGGKALTLELDSLMPGSDVAFTLDLDDTLGGREITVSGAEIQGATVQITSAVKATEAVFGSDAIARAPFVDCSG